MSFSVPSDVATVLSRTPPSASFSKAARSVRLSAHRSDRSPPSASASTTSRLSVGKHRRGGTRERSGSAEGTSAPASVTLSVDNTNASSGPSHVAKAARRAVSDDDDASVLSSASSRFASATPAGCGGRGTSAIRTSTFVARTCDHFVRQTQSSPAKASRVAARSVVVFVSPSSQHSTTRSTSLTPGLASRRATEPRAYTPATRPRPMRSSVSFSREPSKNESETSQPSHAAVATRAASRAASIHRSACRAAPPLPPKRRASFSLFRAKASAVSSGSTAPFSVSTRRLFRLVARTTPARSNCSSARAPADGPPARTRQRANRRAARAAVSLLIASVSVSSSSAEDAWSARHVSRFV